MKGLLLYCIIHSYCAMVLSQSSASLPLVNGYTLLAGDCEVSKVATFSCSALPELCNSLQGANGCAWACNASHNCFGYSYNYISGLCSLSNSSCLSIVSSSTSGFYQKAICSIIIPPKLPGVDNYTMCNGLPCVNGRCSVARNSYFCHCNLSHAGVMCDIPTPCWSNPCTNNGTCINTITSSKTPFICKCPMGFLGDTCEKQLCNSTSCLNGGTCQLLTNGSTVCTCPTNTTGARCENALAYTFCNNSVPCANGICAVERTLSSVVRCKCNVGFIGMSCDVVDACQSNACLNGGTCQVLIDGRTQCHCLPNLTGTQCEKTIPMPQQTCQSSPCQNNGTCITTYVNGQYGYRCLCSTAYYGVKCEMAPCIRNPCQNGDCYVTTTGTRLCICKPGYSGANCDSIVPTAPTPLNPCQSAPCRNGGTCISTVTNGQYGFRCLCSSEFNGITCENAPCRSSPCQNGGTCLVTAAGARQCVCPVGTTGTSCENDICATNPCQNAGTCSVTPSGVRLCTCLSGYSGTYCESQRNLASPNPCQSVPCQNGGTCITTVTNGQYDFWCVCSAYYTGTTCGYAPCQNSPCQNGGTCSLTTTGSTQCLCPLGTTGSNCANAPCSTNPCLNGGTCSVTPSGTQQCVCPSGYYGSTCQNRPCSDYPCSNGGTCVASGYASRWCICSSRYTGSTCDSIVTAAPSISPTLQPCQSSAFSGISLTAATLDFQSRAIASIQASCFSGLTRLQTLYLDSNRITTLQDGEFSSLSALVKLDMSSNQIGTLESGCFRGLSQLQTLYLGYVGRGYGNNLTTLSASSFSGLPALITLDVSYNHLVYLEAGCFAGLTQLQTLYLFNNRLTSLPVGVLAGLDALQTLRLDTNQLASLSPCAFSGLAALQTLNVQSNGFTVLEAALFGDLPALTSLSVDSSVTCGSCRRGACSQSCWSVSSAQPCQSSAFSGISPSATSLDFKSRSIATIEAACFTGLTQLQSLCLSRNQLTMLPAGVFASLTSLQLLQIASNQITTLETGCFTGLAQLELLDLGTGYLACSPFHGNNLTYLSASYFVGLVAMRRMYLSCNQISAIESRSFAHLTQLQFLALFGNRLLSLSADVFAGLAALLMLSLELNQLTALDVTVFRSLPALSTLSIDSGVTCGACAYGLCSRSCWSVDDVTPSPHPCQSSVFSGVSSATTSLDFGSEAIQSVEPDCVARFYQLRTLYLDRNSLTTISKDVFRSLTTLQTLDLSVNQIATLERDCFRGLSQLQRLDLGYGRTGCSSSCNYVTRITTGVFNELSNLTYLDLSRNQIASMDDGCFIGLLQLETLWLSSNRLTSAPADAFSGLSSLLELSLWNNQIAALDGLFFRLLPALSTFYVDASLTWPNGTYNGTVSRCTFSSVWSCS